MQYGPPSDIRETAKPDRMEGEKRSHGRKQSGWKPITPGDYFFLYHSHFVVCRSEENVGLPKWKRRLEAIYKSRS